MWESLTISVNLSTEPKSGDEEQAKNWRNMITNMPLSWLFFFADSQRWTVLDADCWERKDI